MSIINNNSADFGSVRFGTLGQKVELGKSDGVKKETIVKDDNSVFNKLWNSFNKNGDNYLDASELKNLYEFLNNNKKDDKIDKTAVRTMGSQLNIEDLDIKDLEQFVKTIESEEDDIKSNLNRDNTSVTIDDGNKKIIRNLRHGTSSIVEYSDDTQTKVMKRISINGNRTETREFAEDDDSSIVTTTIGSGDNVIFNRVEKRDEKNFRLEATETKGDGSKKQITYESDYVKTTVETDAQGNVVRTIVYNDDETCTVTTADGTQICNKSDYPTGEENIERQYTSSGRVSRGIPKPNGRVTMDIPYRQ